MLPKWEAEIIGYPETGLAMVATTLDDRKFVGSPEHLRKATEWDRFGKFGKFRLFLREMLKRYMKRYGTPIKKVNVILVCTKEIKATAFFAFPPYIVVLSK